jgi:oligopeptide/dipeptide ABC transporter ATP-binding protein
VSDATEPLLEVERLDVSVASGGGRLPILSDVSFSLEKGSVAALVGESGSGKTMTALSLIGLLPDGARVDRGRVALGGKNLLDLSDKEMCSVRGARIGFVFQEPSAALNPVHTIGSQVLEAINLHAAVSRSDARKTAESWLSKVGLSDPARLMQSYPHELSGGMKQRVLLAIALVSRPELLLADEPTASLDRTIEAEVIDRIMQEREERDLTVLLVSHDLARVAQVAESLIVMYAGQIVETGPTSRVLGEPAHPYTQGLLGCIPDPSSFPPRELGGPPRKLPVLAGAPPVFSELAPGCRFEPRCAIAEAVCKEPPPLFDLGEGRRARCFLARRDRETTS